MNFPSWRFVRMWQRNRDVFFKLWWSLAPGFMVEPIILLVALGFGFGEFIDIREIRPQFSQIYLKTPHEQNQIEGSLKEIFDKMKNLKKLRFSVHNRNFLLEAERCGDSFTSTWTV